MIRLRPQAREDIRDIVADLERRSASLSIRQRFYAAFYQSAELQAQWPLIGVRIDIKRDGSAIRRFVIRRFPKYVVFYKAEEHGILIERVVHGARDLPLFLNTQQRD